MIKLKQLIGDGWTMAATVVGLLSFVLGSQVSWGADNPMTYFRAEDAVAYSNCVHSITNVQQGGELYGMTWDKDADYHLDRVFKAGCTDGMSVMGFLCTNVLDNAPQPTVAGYPGCTAFMVTNAAGEHLVGRNLDYMLPMAHVLLFVPKNPALNRKYSSIGSVDSGWVGYDAGQLDDGKTDLSYAALFPYYCMDGMNEKGVMVTILALDARTRPGTGAKDWMIEQFHSNRTNLVLSVAIRYLLDNAGTAAEAVQLMEKFNVFAALGGDLGIVGNYHLYVCDPSGDTRTIEWMPPENEGESWRLCEVKGSKVLSNFHLTDGYGHGSNRWEIARHAIACRDGHLEAPDAMNLCRAVAQRKGTDLTSTTHWSIVYNLDALSADIATLCHYEEIFPYWFKEDNDAWEIGEAKSVKPSVETDLPAYDAKTAEAGKVYRTTVSNVESEPEWRPSVTGACVSAVNRMGCTYETAGEPIHVVVKMEGTTKMLFYADYTGAVSSFLCEHIVAGMNAKGVSARVARFRTSGATGGVPSSMAVYLALSNSKSTSAAAAAGTLSGSLPELSGTGVIFTDAMGNVAVWPAGSELVTDDASEMVKYSLDLRQGIYEVDGEGRGQFDELPGLMRLAASADTKAIVSMGYGHLDVMLPNSNVLWRTELEGVTIPAYGVIAEPKVVAHATAKLTYESGDAIAVNNQGRLVAETNALLKVTYKTESDDYYFPDGTHSWTQTFRAGETTTTPPAPGAAQLREPDYAEETGKDWLFNHALAGKAYAGEAAESAVDLFYVYPTLAGGEKIVIDGFRGIDDKTMRSDVLSFSTAAGAFDATGRCFADLMHVYAPFYRQATLDTACDCATNATGQITATANADYLAKLCEGPAYADVTNALTTYFAKWNNGRRVVFAAHSQGSALLRLVMENYFTLPENKDKAKRIICSYQIGFGIGQSSIDKITAANGMTFATKADDTNVIVSYNAMSKETEGYSILLPHDTLAINPITWTRGTDLAEKSLNLGALTNAIGTADVIVPHLYSARVADTGAKRGKVVVCAELLGHELAESLFGEGSLHGNDYSAFWEDLHKNCYDRITASTGKAPRVGRPMDYGNKSNWLRLGDKDLSKSTDKPFDIFYVYPTSTGSSEYVAPVDGDMKERALGNYRQSVEPLESYANVYAPYYRQISATGIMADPTVDALQRNIARHVGKTDFFAALDYYFTNVNVNATRPFVFASHSQGSASLKNAFEQYFVGEKKDYLEKMIAAYTVGYTFSTDWCAKYGVTFATGAADTGVLLTWNAEGPNAPALANMLTKDPNGQAINPLNWKTDETYAPVSENLGSFVAGQRVAGAADAQLKAARPGAVVVTNVTGYAYAPAVLFGEESYHFDEWGMFRENACANILDRGKSVNGYCKFDTSNFPAQCFVTQVVAVCGSPLKTTAHYVLAGTVWTPTNGLEGATIFLFPKAGYRIVQKDTGSVLPYLGMSFDLTDLGKDGMFHFASSRFDNYRFEWVQRDPDYAEATGKDWLFHHDIPAKRYEGEPAKDPGVDLFYLYPTSAKASDDHTVDGICDIDDPYLRGPDGATNSWEMSGKVFGDFTRVYAPYYRQTPLDVEMTFTPQEGCWDEMTKYWYERAPYTDVTNALTHYFTTINPNGERPFVFAGHSHGSGMLILVMEHFFKDHPQWLGNMVACYAIGMGVSDKWEESVKGYAPIATNATDAGVYVFWNTEGAGTSEGMTSGLWPTNHVPGVNPITWSRDAASFAPASLNIGGFTADDSGAVRPGLYDASNNVAHGTVVCSSPELAGSYIPVWMGFGEKSLHGLDYKLYWENIRANALQRIKTLKAKIGEPDYDQIPLAGTPINYGNPYNWVTNTGTAKPLDVFYVYPTMMLEGDSAVVPVTDAMKEKAYGNSYVGAASAFAEYANIIIPAYRQLNMAAVTAAQALYTEPRDFVDYLKGGLPRTDLFAALDYYFTNLNVKAERPFILAGHSQGSAMLKIAFEDYFRSNPTRNGYLKKMVATYGLGYSFAQDWFDGYYPEKDLTFATNATDKAVLVSWNTEGPDAQGRSFVIENGALAVNPMTWTTATDVWSETVPDAMIQERTATDYTYAAGTYALVTTNSTAYLNPSMGFGEKSLHGEDWSLWYDQVKENGFTRYAAFAGLKEVSVDNIPAVADATWVIETKSKDTPWAEAIKSPAGTYYVDGTSETRNARVTYTVSPEKAAANFVFQGGKTTRSFTLKYDKAEGKWYQPQPVADILEATKVIYNQRKPDYTQAKDWLLNHALRPDEARDVAGEPSQDPGVDLVYVYGTIAMTNAETTVNGFADLDDPQMRGDESTHTGGAWGMIPGSVKAFSDYTRVYMPFYRQMTLCGATNVMTVVGMEGANKAFADALHGGVAYEDLEAALDAYFDKWNEGRPFILAGCSQGAAMLRNMVEHYFTASEKNKAKLDQLVACYGIAYGVTKDWAENVEALTDGKIHFATNATERGVYISWNTVGPDSTAIPNGLVPSGAISVNPLTWTTEATPATADTNLGSLTNVATGAVIPHLYDATVDTAKGVVVSTNLPASDYVKGLVWFGDKSLHTWEMSAWWENIRLNAYQRIETATGRKPCCGTPTDYSASENWMSRPEAADKGLDVFYLYPTCVPGTCTTLIGEIEDGMKAAANEHYKKGPSAFESYANVYAPYYRQGSGLALISDLSPDGIQRFGSTHVVKTDVFAALDWYFANRNPGAARPFILASHSQGSANMKNVFEEYFVGEKADYTNNLVAAYILGYKITPDWCEKVGVPFATGEADARVVMTWNAEGPGASSDNFLTADPDQLAINPINWKTDATEALKADNLGSVVTNAAGVLHDTGKPGVTGARLQAGRAGAVIVDAPETIPVGISPGFGTKSYHFEDWAFFHDNIGANGLNRYATLTDQAYVDPYDFRVDHASFVVQTVGSDVLNGPAGAAVVEKGAQAFAVYTAEEGYIFGAKDSTATVALDTSVSPVRPAAGAVLPVARSASVRFERSSYEVQEGGALRVRVCRDAIEEAAQATLSYVKNTGSYSGAYMDGKKVSFPLTLSWAKYDYEPKEIVFQTTASVRAEADKTFTLQLSAKVGEVEFLKLAACTVTIKDAQGGAEAKPYVRVLAWPANAGTVSGSGELPGAKSYRTLSASAKTYATFAGWYKAKADDPDVIDLESPVEPHNPRYPKQIRVGYGTANEAGTYFAYFTNVLAVAAVVEPKAFDETGTPLPGVAGVRWPSYGYYLTYVGVKFSLPVDFLDDSGKGSLSVSKLPSGLAYNRKTGRIEGVPTRAGSYEVQFVASNAAGKHTVTYTFAVGEIPSGAVGTFYGVVSEEDSDRTGIGSVAFTAGKTGSLSAKVLRRLSGTRSFSVKGYDYIDSYTFGVAMTNSYGEVFEATLRLLNPVDDVLLEGTAFGGERKGTLGANGETNGTFVATRNAFATGDGDADAQQLLAAYKGTYGETLYATNGLGVAEEAVGTVQYRVQSNGNVYLAAKVAKTHDGEKAVSAKTFTGTVTGGFLYNKARGVGGCAAALRNGTYLWSTEALFDYSTRAVEGQARYIRPNAEDKTKVVDVDQFVGGEPDDE